MRATSSSRASRSERSSAIAVSAASIRIDAAIRLDPSTACAQPTTSTATASSLRRTGSKCIDTAPVAITTRCEIRSSPCASWTKSGFFERKTDPAPEASSPSETVSGGPFSSPWFAVITSSPSGLRSMSLAKRAPVIVQAAAQMISRAIIGVSRPGQLTGRLRDRGHADDELPRLLLADLQLVGTSQVLLGPRLRCSRTSDCTVNPMIGATHSHTSARVHSLDGYSGAPIRKTGTTNTAARPAKPIASCCGLP